MAVPKRKTSKARRDKRRANWKLVIPGMVACPQFVRLADIIKAKKLLLLSNYIPNCF